MMFFFLNSSYIPYPLFKVALDNLENKYEVFAIHFACFCCSLFLNEH